MIVEMMTVGPAEENCFVVGCERTRQAMLVDPGDEPERIVQRLGDLQLQAVLMVVTHAHWDHVNAVRPVQEATGAALAIHPADVDLLMKAPETAFQRTGRRGPEPPQPDRLLGDGDAIQIGDLRFRVVHTPGHTPGGICIVGEGVVFTGDTLMTGWVGRTDFPGGSLADIQVSLYQKILALPDETVVYAGHLEPTTIGKERQENPYLTGKLPPR